VPPAALNRSEFRMKCAVCIAVPVGRSHFNPVAFDALPPPLPVKVIRATATVDREMTARMPWPA